MFCVSHFSIAVIKCHDQKQLTEEFVLAYGSRGLHVLNGRGGVTGPLNLYLHTGNRKSKDWNWGGAITSLAPPPAMTSSRKASLPKSSHNLLLRQHQLRNECSNTGAVSPSKVGKSNA